MPLDVIVGRTPWAWRHPGNIRFRTIIAELGNQYHSASTRRERGVIVSRVVYNLRQDGVRLLRFVPQTETWIEVDRDIYVIKVGQALRDRRRVIAEDEGGEPKRPRSGVRERGATRSLTRTDEALDPIKNVMETRKHNSTVPPNSCRRSGAAPVYHLSPLASGHITASEYQKSVFEYSILRHALNNNWRHLQDYVSYARRGPFLNVMLGDIPTSPTRDLTPTPLEFYCSDVGSGGELLPCHRPIYR